MAHSYQFNLNSINDFFITTLLEYNEDISKKAPQDEIKRMMIEFLSNYVDENELKHLDYEIKKNKHGFKVIANNFPSALFFNNVIVNNFSTINGQKELEVNNIIYSFNERKKVLTKKHKNGQIKRS